MAKRNEERVEAQLAKKRLPRPVDYWDNQEDFECAYLGSIGLSTKCIMRNTKLRAGQITYRLQKAQVRRMDYRDGTSETARIVMTEMRGAIERYVNHHLREVLK